jgi:hypothetical protein
MDFLAALTPAPALLQSEKRARSVVLQERDVASELGAVACMARRAFPGLHALEAATCAHPAAVMRAEQLLLPRAAFDAAALDLLPPCGGECAWCGGPGAGADGCRAARTAGVAAVAQACRAVGRPAVAVDDVLSLCCIALERRLHAVLAASDPCHHLAASGHA